MADEIPNIQIVGTVSDAEVATITSTAAPNVTTQSQQSEFATVEASAQGDIVNGVQTSTNAVSASADVGTQTAIRPGTTEEYANANRGLPPSTVGTPQQTVPNPLHNYPSYTYGISLHMLNPSDFNQMVNSMVPNIKSTVLIASAGRWNNIAPGLPGSFYRNPVFNDDFFFEDLKIKSVIGMTPANRSANNIDMNFTIIEPNGFTFINRLLEVATTTDAKNYLEIPYMLQIDFFGYNDAGTAMHLTDQTKHIPISITGIKTKVGTKGAEYRITAVPYQHKAFQQSVAATPTNIQVKAATVRDFFGTSSTIIGVDGAYAAASTQYLENQRIETLKKELAATTDSTVRQDIQFQISQIENNLNQVYTATTGYVDAFNGWYKLLFAKNKRRTVDTVSVVIDPEIASATIVTPERNDIRGVSDPTKAEQNAARSAALGATVGGPKFSSGYYPVSAGVPIDKVIEDVIKNSSYMTNQIVDPAVDNPETIAKKFSTPLQWFKIIPKVVIGDYDYVTGQYAKHYVYYVKKWTVSNKVPVAPMGKASGFVKKYEYLYSGHNNDVIDFNIDFDTLYYIQMTEDKSSELDTTNMKKPWRNVVDGSAPYVAPPNTAFPSRYVWHTRDLRDSIQNRTQLDAKKLSSADTIRDLAGTARGDMLNVKLGIIGDPTFIKQDEIFYNHTEQRTNKILTSNNSLVMDEGELYTLLFFKTPSDYNEAAGLHINSRYSWSMFSGIYGITTVESVFNKGKFTQTLDLYRLQHQPAFDDLLGGQMGAVLQYQRIENKILDSALTSLQGISRNAAGQLLGTLSNVLSVATAAQQIAQNAQAIATGLISATINNTLSSVGGVVKNWFTDVVVDPVKKWAADTIFTPLSEFFTDRIADIRDWFSDTFFPSEMGTALFNMFSGVDLATATPVSFDLYSAISAANALGVESITVPAGIFP